MHSPLEKSRAERLLRLTGLYAVVGDPDPIGSAEAVLDGGARVVQVRMKEAPSGEVLAAARRIVERAQGRALVIVNDRADIAALADADGVHLGDEDLPTPDARAVIGPSLLIGRTCRTTEEARAAVAAGADYVGFGPVFATRSKTLAVPPRGLEALAALCHELPAPVVAIGGISAETIEDVAAAGAAAAAVIEDLLARGDVRARAELLAARFDAGARGRSP